MNEESLYNYKCKIERIIDGDSIVVWIDLGFDSWIKEVIRLYDVDTPEIRGIYAEESGKWASLYTKLWFSRKEHLIPVMESIDIKEAYEITQPYETFKNEIFWVDSRKYNARGKYGRLLGEIFRKDDDISLNQSLINAGYEKQKK
jgi:micrococcal nuclease